MSATTPIQRALISVSDKLGLADFAAGLTSAGVEIFSTGGTRRHLEAVGVPVRDITGYTGFPEILGGRVKTLHPKVFGGILGRRDLADDVQVMADHGIEPFELVVVNLYPFEAAIVRPETNWPEAIEQIDIGGPSLIRASAKNCDHVAIVTHPGQYSSVLREIQQTGGVAPAERKRLAAEAFALTAGYDRAIARYFSESQSEAAFPSSLQLTLHHKTELRYGENPHQRAALYRRHAAKGANLVNARQLHGKELSYNNYLDLDSALAMARSYQQPACVVIKHNNPCGASVSDTLCDAAAKALAGDPVSAFGSILGFNRIMDCQTAEVLAQPGTFIEAIVAPDFEAAAVGVLTTRPKWKDNVRLIQVGRLDDQGDPWNFRFIEGGVLVQDVDEAHVQTSHWRVVTEDEPFEHLWLDLQFAWQAVLHVRSNAIVLCGDQSLYGVGAGQMSRVDAVELAIRKAGQRAEGSVLASDAFFPFPDSIYLAAQAGVRAVVQPGGSRQDAEVIAACNELDLPMVFTGRRHFKH